MTNLYILFALILSSVQSCPDLPKLKFLPGFGYDALTDKQTIQLMKITYTESETSIEEKYLIPDKFEISEDISHKYDPSVEFFENMLNFTSPTSRSMRKPNDIWPSEYQSLYFSLSDEYRKMKKLHLERNAFTTRSQNRNTFYRVNTTKESRLSDFAEEQLEEIINLIKSNKTEEAKNKIRTFVLNYGTHYVTSINLGYIEQSEYTTTHYLIDLTSLKKKAPIITEKNLLKLDAAYSIYGMSRPLWQDYKNSVVEESIQKIGGLDPDGKVYSTHGEKMNREEAKMTIIDRSGELISSIITPSNFPHEQPQILMQVGRMMNDAIREYYLNNTHRGCMTQNAVNFNSTANVDDGSCQGDYLMSFLSEVIRCIQTMPLSLYDACTSRYQPRDCIRLPEVRIHGRSTAFRYKEYYECYTASGCKEKITTSRSHLEYYHCFKPYGPRVTLFGGVYSSLLNNTRTLRKSCPLEFTAIKSKYLPTTYFCQAPSSSKSARYAVKYLGVESCQSSKPYCRSGGERFLLDVIDGCEFHICLDTY